MISFDIIIVSYNRPELLVSCLSSIFRQTSLNLQKVIIIENGEAELDIPLGFKDKILLVATNNISPSEARNIGIKKTTSDYILFLDDDVLVPAGYFEFAVSRLNSKKLDVLGGPDQTYPNSNFFQKSLGISLKSWMMTGHTFKRHCRQEGELEKGDEGNLILCHLWFKSSLFHIEGFSFSKDYYRNEENVLLESLRNKNKKIGYHSSLYIYHYRKRSLSKALNAVFVSSFFRKKSLFQKKTKFNFFFFCPSLFNVYLLTLFFKNDAYLFLPLLGYFLLSFLLTSILQKGAVLNRLYAFFIQIIVNIVYGIGFLFPLFLESYLKPKNK